VPVVLGAGGVERIVEIEMEAVRKLIEATRGIMEQG
jgi:hypothetical protein